MRIVFIEKAFVMKIFLLSQIPADVEPVSLPSAEVIMITKCQVVGIYPVIRYPKG